MMAFYPKVKAKAAVKGQILLHTEIASCAKSPNVG